MQFRLPQQLQNELVAYDPALKALARQQKPKSSSKKPKFPFGKPNNLIPSDVIRQSLIDDAIEHINNNPAPDRYHVFKRLKNVGTPEAISMTNAIIYYYESVWYAAWLPPQGKEDEYLFGYSIAYKDTDTCRKKLSSVIQRNFAELTESVQYGKPFFRFYTTTVTKQDILDGCRVIGWNIPAVPTYYQKSRDLRVAINGFEATFRKTVPIWDDSRGIYDRLLSDRIANILFESGDLNENVKEQIFNDPDWKPSYQTFQHLILEHSLTSGYRGDDYQKYNKVLHIIDKPFFRKWIQERCNECIENLNDPENNLIRNVKRPWKLIHHLIRRICQVHSIWPECPIDHYQNYLDVLMGTRISNVAHEETVEWIRDHMPVASFFNELSKNYEKSKEEQRQRGSTYYDSTELGISIYPFPNWDDTCSMIRTLITNGVEVPVPKRWRIEEFHDTIQAEAWKIKNPNEKLPQDLFPTPIKLEYQGENWTFFQPHDTHQLALWGQAVRNCIGSASSYAEGVRKKVHFLVLCMVNNKPRFTVQLDVHMGMMSVKQIVGLSNSRLSQLDRDLYTTTFGEALKLREAELVQ